MILVKLGCIYERGWKLISSKLNQVVFIHRADDGVDDGSVVDMINAGRPPHCTGG